jgi:hypothetical protein
MEEMGSMNTFTALFGIFRQRGLVLSFRENRPIRGFIIFSVLLSILGGILYGFAMGIGLGPETAISDAIKVGLIITLGLFFAFPVFWLAYRLLGREEKLSQVIAIPLTFVATAAIVLAVSAPIVFILSLLTGASPEGVYIHIVIVDLALLVGLYLAGTLISNGFTMEKAKLIVPNVIGFLMLGVILVVLILFFSPFLALRSTFSVGTDLLKDRLGMGVSDKALQALQAAAVAERITYKFQTTNQNSDLERDYTVTRVGEDYLVDVHLHAVTGEKTQVDRRIWIVGDEIYTNFAEGKVAVSDRSSLASYLEPALTQAAFSLPDDFSNATWRGYSSGEFFTAIGVTAMNSKAQVVLDAGTLRLSRMVLGSTLSGLFPEIRVSNVQVAALDKAGLVASLNQAIVLGSVDHTNASLQDYIQKDVFFVIQAPKHWNTGNWDASKRKVTFVNYCDAVEGCPQLAVLVYNLTINKNAVDYAQDLATSLSLQPEFREIKISTTSIDGQSVGVVEYLFDKTVKGTIQTTHHIEYIFVGSLLQYHLDFSAPEVQFGANRDLFKALAGGFTYLRESP